MERNFNIAEILKDKPKGTKLYADAFGELSIEEICTEDNHGITLSDNGGTDWLFYNDGKYSWRGESILVPSKEMRDWRKFAWKKGDVLVSNDGEETIFFDRFTDDTYTQFVGKYVWGEGVPAYRCFSEKEETLFTKNYSLEENKENIKKHILTVEACILKAGLNVETLETIPLKDGDIYFCKTYGAIKIGIFKSLYEDHNEVYISNYVYYHANVYTPYLDYSNDDWVDGGIYRPATNEEKQQLFDALAKVGKAWDAEKKQIVDLKSKWTPKPFDRVISRTPDTPWTANFFSHIDSDGIKNCIDDRYLMCLPYNEETAKLIGTTNNWEG